MSDPAPSAPVVPPRDWPVRIGPLEGNRAALGLLAAQQVFSAFAVGFPAEIGGRTVRIGLGLPLGWALLTTFALTALCAALFFRPTLRRLTADPRWRTPPAWGLALAAFALGFVASRAFALAATLAFPGLSADAPQFVTQGADFVPLLIAAGLLIPLAEEIAFRGLMMRGQETAAGFRVAALASSAAFAVAHGVPLSILAILPLAYTLARVVQASGSLWSGVIVHALNNTLAVLLGAWLLGSGALNLDTAASQELLNLGPLRWAVAVGALVFGGVVLWVIHLMLPPRPEPGTAPGPVPGRRLWLSASYVVIVTFGLLTALLTQPAVLAWLRALRP